MNKSIELFNEAYERVQEQASKAIKKHFDDILLPVLLDESNKLLNALGGGTLSIEYDYGKINIYIKSQYVNESHTCTNGNIIPFWGFLVNHEVRENEFIKFEDSDVYPVNWDDDSCTDTFTEYEYSIKFTDTFKECIRFLVEKCTYTHNLLDIGAITVRHEIA